MMPHRRLAAIAVGMVIALVASTTAMAQQASRSLRIGAVSAGAGRSAPHWKAFDQRLAELGYIEGRNITIEFRNAEGNPERLPGLFAELVRSGVDLIFAPGPESALRAAKDATPSIPIVVVAIDYDPVARGLVGGLARPGGNVTGIFVRQPELTAKRVGLLKEALPELSDIAVFWDSFSTDQLGEADAAARSAGLSVHRFEFRGNPYKFDGPMGAAAQKRAVALLGLASPVFFRQRAQLAESAIKYHVPSIAPFRESAEAGMLMSYGASLPDTHRRAAEYVDKILKGARPTDLPMEQPTQFELVINLATARALGLKLAPALLLRADYVIQ